MTGNRRLSGASTWRTASGLALTTALIALAGCTVPTVNVTAPPETPQPPDIELVVPSDAVDEEEEIVAPEVEPAPEPIEISFTWVGDMTFGMNNNFPPGGVGTVLDHVRTELQSTNLTLGNLETALGTGPTTKCIGIPENCYAFQAPPETGQALAEAGFDIVSLANNHANDSGPAGIASTKAALSAAGVAWTGLADNQIAYLEHDGATIAFMAFAPYSSVANALDRVNVVNMVKEADANADLVVVMMHLGAEGDNATHVRPGVETAFGENRGDSMGFARAVINAGADLVVGSGPHVLRGMEWYQGRLIAYSLGNFSGYHSLAMGGIKGISGILQITLDSDGEFVSGRLVPVTITSVGTPSIDAERRAIPMVQRLSAEDFGENAVQLTDDGVITPPAERLALPNTGPAAE